VRPGSPLPLLGKRALGWLSWRVRRREIHKPEILEALLDDLHAARPDHTVITGDLTNISLPEEFVVAREWLSRIGSPEAVSAVPGNHDAYVAVPHRQAWGLWNEYLASDAAGLEWLTRAQAVAPDGKPELSFPTLRLRGPLGIVGACSAVPTAPLLAAGQLGSAQLERLERILFSLGEAGRCRVVLLHHPPGPGKVARRRALRDAERLVSVLARTGAELILHGHLHRTCIDRVPGPAGPIPVVGVRSASDHGSKPGKRAEYHLYDFEQDAGRYRITLRRRPGDEAPLRLDSA
jgi:3',5'-cyclic AMP phosphodiesterase CpdA